MKVLITGGAGYIGSHIYAELIDKGYEPIILDNLSNSTIKTIENLALLTKKEVQFFNIDMCDEVRLDHFISSQKNIEFIIHCAGFKSVPNSVSNPLNYYYNNLSSTINLLKVMEKNNIQNLIFSSSASVYGVNSNCPISEVDIVKPVTPYAQTKLMAEQIIKDYSESNPDFSYVILRYFNPIGAHKSSEIGPSIDQMDINVMSHILKVALGLKKYLNIFGNDYPTKDGTAIRDFIHITDVARGHIKAIEFLQTKSSDCFNLGTGKGYSVLELVKAFEFATDIKIPYKYVNRRDGDIGISYADTKKAFKELNWKNEETIESMCRDSWNWIKKIKAESP